MEGREAIDGLVDAVREALTGDFHAPGVVGEGTGGLPSRYDVTGIAVATIGAACAEVAALAGRVGVVPVHRALASRWFAFSVRPRGWELPPVWDAIAGVYRTRDGWIRLHTNAPHHRAAAVAALGCADAREAVAAAVAEHEGDALETAVVDAGGCAAVLRTPDAWAAHPQGRALAGESLVAWETHGVREAAPIPLHAERPLAGLRVLDLTRVLAGPVCTRFLAGYGAEVLRIDPPGWGEAVLEPEVTLGKRCATLDLRTAEGADTLRRLVADADLLVHGYRPGALRGLGLDAAALREVNPRLVDVSLCAWGWTGPWAARRGYDSLVQMSTGIAAPDSAENGGEPAPLPVQALDQATGYLMAAAAVRALRLRRETGAVSSARTSLARTARWLAQTRGDGLPDPLPEETDADLAPGVEATDWGEARRLRFPARIDGAEAFWEESAHRLHRDAALWP